MDTFCYILQLKRVFPLICALWKSDAWFGQQKHVWSRSLQDLCDTLYYKLSSANNRALSRTQPTRNFRYFVFFAFLPISYVLPGRKKNCTNMGIYSGTISFWRAPKSFIQENANGIRPVEPRLVQLLAVGHNAMSFQGCSRTFNSKMPPTVNRMNVVCQSGFLSCHLRKIKIKT